MKRIISLIVLQAFILSSVGFADISFDKLSPKGITIPKNIGSIKEEHKGSNGKLVIHIQDAHCNYEAQTNIAKILGYLIKEHNINLVAVEGADGVVNTSWFKAFPDAAIRKDVADYFMRKGEITATEFLSITTDYPFTIYGVEDKKYYIRNLTSFLESYPHKEEFRRFFKNVKSALARLKKFIYTEELAELDRTIIRHEEEGIAFGEYIEYLNKLSGSRGISLKEYKNVGLLVKSLKYEKDIDFKAVNEERAGLIDRLSKKLSKDSLSKLVNKASEFKQDKIGTEIFHSYLVNLAKKNKIPITGEYQNLNSYIIYSHIYGKIDNEKLFDEKGALVKALKEKMFVNESQKTLDKLWANVNIMLAFAEINLLNKDYEYYLADKDGFTPAKFTEFIKQKSSAFGLAYNVGDPPRELENIFSRLVDFYEIGLKRDGILVKNMFNGMRGKKTDTAVLITGGFHTKGIAKLLKENGASYVVVTPAITKDAESPYISVLTGQKVASKELFTETSELAAPYLCDGDILKGLERASLSKEGRKLAENILAGRDYTFVQYAGLYIHAYIANNPDTPYNPGRGVVTLRDNMIADFERRCEAVRHDDNVRKLRAYLKSGEGRMKFDSIYRGSGGKPNEIESIIHQSARPSIGRILETYRNKNDISRIRDEVFYEEIKIIINPSQALTKERIKGLDATMHAVAERAGSFVARREDATGYSLWNIQEEHVALYSLKQFYLAYEILDRVFGEVERNRYSETEKNELIEIIQYFFYAALPEFIDGRKGNPIHHNVQALENMLTIVLAEKQDDYEFLKIAVVLALLHDIGNSRVSGEKVISSDLKKLKERIEAAKNSKDKQNLEKKLHERVTAALDYRRSHMVEGSKLAPGLISDYEKHYTDKRLFAKADVDNICATIAIHDNPSSAKYKKDYLEELDAELLFSANDELAKYLREADRAWMLSPEGFEKDLIDAKKKEFEEGETAKNPKEQLAHNKDEQHSEYAVYEDAFTEVKLSAYEFKEKTLYRTEAGYSLYQEFVNQIEVIVALDDALGDEEAVQEIAPIKSFHQVARPPASQEEVKLMKKELSKTSRKVIIFGGGTGTNFFSQIMQRLGWEMVRVLTPFDEGGRTGKIKRWMKKHRKLDFFAIGDLTKVLVEQATHSPAIQKIMEKPFEGNGNLAIKTNEAINSLFNDKDLDRSYVIDSSAFEKFVTEIRELSSDFDRDFKSLGFNIHNHSLRHLIYLQCFWNEYKKGKSYQQAVEEGTRRFIELLGITESQAFLSSVDMNLGFLVAENKEKTTIEHQDNITRINSPKHPELNIGLVDTLSFNKRSQPQANTHVTEELGQLQPGDMIILGPGSFYTSLICNLLPRGITTAIADARKRGVISVFAFNPIYSNETIAMKDQRDTFVRMVEQIEKHSGDYRFDDLFNYGIVNDTETSSDDVLNLMSEDGSKEGDKQFERSDKLRRGAIEQKNALIGYFKDKNYAVTTVTGNLMSVKETSTGREATYNPDKFVSVLNAVAQDHALSRVSEAILLSDPHATIDGLLCFKNTLPGRTVFNNGDMIDRGDELWNLMKLIDYFTLGDHELWAIGACLGHDYLLALWLRSLYRYPMTTKILEDLGIDTEKLKDFSQKKYGEEPWKKLKEDIGEEYKGPKNHEEQALFNIWIKLAIQAAEDLGREGKDIPPSLKDVLSRFSELPPESLIAKDSKLTDEEKRVFNHLKDEFLRPRPEWERSTAKLASHFLKGRVYQIAQPLPDIVRAGELEDVGFYKANEYPKVLLLHGNIPMNGLGQPVNLLGQAIRLENLKDYFDELNENLAKLEKQYQNFLRGDIEYNEIWNCELKGPVINPKEWLMRLADTEFSPLFARKQMRVRTYLDTSSEPDNIAYAFLTRNYRKDYPKDKDKAKLNSPDYEHGDIKKSLITHYGLVDEDFVGSDGKTHVSGDLYLRDESANKKIAKKITEAFGIDAIILGHIGRKKETGEPVKLAGGKIWMIDGSFAKKSGETGMLPAEETGGFLLLRQKQRGVDGDNGIVSGRLATVGEILANVEVEGRRNFDLEKITIISSLRLKELLYYNGAKLEWERLSQAPGLMQDLLALFSIAIPRSRPVLSFTREEWLDFYNKRMSDDNKSDLVKQIKSKLRPKIEDEIDSLSKEIAEEKDSKKRKKLEDQRAELEEVVVRDENNHVVAITQLVITQRITKNILRSNKDSRLSARLTVKPLRFILPVWINDELVLPRPELTVIDPELIKDLGPTLEEVFARPSQPDNTVYKNSLGLDKSSPGGAVTVDGRPLTNEQKAEVDEAVASDFESTSVERTDTVGDVEIYMCPSLEPLTYLVAHPGRGGEACNHLRRRIYMSLSRIEWLRTLSAAARRQFITHEIAHLDNPDLNEEEVQKIAPIDKVLAEIAASEAIKEVAESGKAKILDMDTINLIKKAAYGVAAYLEENFRTDKIALDIYTGKLPLCVSNIADWLTNSGIEETTQVGLRQAILDGRWEDLASAYDSKRPAFGTAGVRTDVAKNEEDFLALAEGADEGRGFEIPILRGPNTFNPEIVKIFTLAMLKWKAKNAGAQASQSIKKIKVGIARDSRIAGQEFVDLMRKICLAFGITLYIGDEPMPLPEFSNAIKECGLDFGLYVSASHNPRRSNGLKIIGPGGAQMGADPVARKEIETMFNETTPLEAKGYLERFSQAEIEQDQVVFIGGSEKLPREEADFAYGEHRLVDTHTMHVNAVERKVNDTIMRKHGMKLNVGYCSFYGAGRKSAPRMLEEFAITNFDVVQEMAKLDGRFPGLEVPDPSLAAAWKVALQSYENQAGREALLKKNFWLSNDPDADRFGLVMQVRAEEIPENKEVAEAMGIVLRLTPEEERQYGYGGFRVIPPNEWASLITAYDLDRMAIAGRGGKIEGVENLLIAFSHVTSDLLPAIAESYGVPAQKTPVGVDQIAKLIEEVEKETPKKHVVAGVEESGTYTTGDHILDKDGFLAGMRIAEIACAGIEQKKTLGTLLDELSHKHGLFATTNNYMEFANNIPERTRRINVMKWFKDVLYEEARKRATAGSHLRVAGFKIYGTDMQEEFKTGKYDKITFEGFPDAGIRLYLSEDKKSYITIRPSGTEPKIRFYVQIHDASVIGKDSAYLAGKKKEAYTNAVELAKAFITIANTADMGVVEMLGRVHETKNAAPVLIAHAGESTVEYLGIAGNRAIGRVAFKSIDDVVTQEQISQLTGKKPFRVLVEKRSLIESSENGSIDVKAAGKERNLADRYGDSVRVEEAEYKMNIQNTPPEPYEPEIVAYIEYEPSEGEMIVHAGYEAMRANRARFKEVQEGKRKPVVLHVPGAMFPKNSLSEEKKILKGISGGAATLRAYGTAADSLNGLKNQQWNPEYKHVFVMLDEDLKTIRGDRSLMDALGNVLRERILPVEKSALYTREVETCAATLGFTDIKEVEGDVVKGHGRALQAIMCRLTGRQTIELHELRFLFGAFVYADVRIDALITSLLIPARPVTGELRDFIRTRRDLLWAV